ncbi:ion channel [Chlamydiota bacterium]
MMSLLLTLILFPFLSEFSLGSLFLEVFFTFILLSGIFVLSERKKLLFFAVGLAIITLAINWTHYFIKNSILFSLSHILYLSFFLLTILSILIHIFKSETITAEKIFGAISVYFLIGITWALLFSLIEYLLPGSFALSIVDSSSVSVDFSETSKSFPFLYYSLVTLTTLGYGDITPISPPAQILSAFEAMLGQLYLAILIARLVGLHILHRNRENS